VDVGVVGQHVAGGVRTGQIGRVGCRDGVNDRKRGVVGEGDGEGQSRGVGAGGPGADLVGETVGQGAAGIELVDRRVRIVDDVGVAAGGVDRHRTVQAGNRVADIAGQASDLGEAQLRIVVVDVGVVGQHVAGGVRTG